MRWRSYANSDAIRLTHYPRRRQRYNRTAPRQLGRHPYRYRAAQLPGALGVGSWRDTSLDSDSQEDPCHLGF